MNGESCNLIRGIVQFKFDTIAEFIPLQLVSSSVKIPLDWPILIRYDVIGEPFWFGVDQVITRLFATTVVVGGSSGIEGMKAQRSYIASDISESP